MRRSRRMRASTGNAVMLIEMPMNSAKAVNEAPAAARSLKRNQASTTPSRYGNTMLDVADHDSRVRPAPHWPTSSSMPTVNMNRQTPIWLRSRSDVRARTPETPTANASGVSHPNSDGPSRMPAAISPTTEGCPRRANSFPTSRDTAMITRSCSRRRMSGPRRPVPIHV